MGDKQKAFTWALIGFVALAGSMYGFYRVKDRLRNTAESEVDITQPADPAKKEEPGAFTGIYSASEALEANGKRFAFFTVSRKEDGAYGGTAKLDTIGGAAGDSVFFSCADVKASEKELFLQCAEPTLGQLSFHGEWQSASNVRQVNGSLLWSKDGNPILDKKVSLSHTPE